MMAKHKLPRVLLTLALLASFLGLAGQAGQAQSPPPDPYITMDAQFVDVGETFDVPVLFGTNFEVRSVTFDFHFDPAIVRVESISEGSFLSDFALANGGSTTFTPGTLNPAAGLVDGVNVSVSGAPGMGALGGGVLVVIRLTALQNGRTHLMIDNIMARDQNNYPLFQTTIVTGGLVHVGPPPSLSISSLLLVPTGTGADFGRTFNVLFSVTNISTSPSVATTAAISTIGAAPLYQEISVPALGPGEQADFTVTNLQVTATVAIVTVSLFGDGNRSVIYNFTLAADNGDTIVDATVRAYLDLTLPLRVDFGLMALGLNTQQFNLNVRCNANYQVDLISDRNWRLTQFDGASYGANTLTEALQIASSQNLVSEGTPSRLINGDLSGQSLDLGQDWPLTASQMLRFADALLPSGQTYHMEMTFNAYVTF